MTKYESLKEKIDEMEAKMESMDQCITINWDRILELETIIQKMDEDRMLYQNDPLRNRERQREKHHLPSEGTKWF